MSAVQHLTDKPEGNHMYVAVYLIAGLAVSILFGLIARQGATDSS